MTDSQAEHLDPTVLGEEIGDSGRPGDDFPPDEPLAVDDPAILGDGAIARDDVEQRDGRLRPETAAPSTDDDPGPGLVDGASGDGPTLADGEQQLVADEVEHDGGPEAAAVRIESETP